jgi:hypothetical protein
MMLDSFKALAAALEHAGVRYLVAGGLAVNAHGYVRYTKDVDLVIQLGNDNVERAFAALASLGYRAIVPIVAAQFADPAQREGWIREKGMRVLNFQSDQHRFAPVDVFASEPFGFDEEYDKALQGEVAPGLVVRFVCLSTLIAMKEVAGRPNDLVDIQHLRWILEDKSNGSDS